MNGRLEMKIYRGAVARDSPLNVMVEARAGVGAIEFWLMQAQQFEFARASGDGASAPFQRDGFDLVNQARETARDAIGVCVFVEGEARAKVFRLANVEDAIRLAAHDVNAGLARRSFEKFVAQSLDQRSWQRE
jgi:hypothetical protein